jgi:hypothetical protein
LVAETKYEKYIIREPLGWNTFPPFAPRLLFDCKNYFPEQNFGIRYTYITEPIHMERPHAHDFDQFFCFMGALDDLRVFDGEVELYLGEESTKNIINSTSVVFVPKGMVHCPVIWTRVNRPMAFINIVMTASYTRSDQRIDFFDRMELTAKKVSVKEAGQVLGAALPQPAYLPAGHKIQEILAVDNTIKVLISDGPIEKRLINVGDANGSRQVHAFTCKMELTIKWHPGGRGKGREVRGEMLLVGKEKGFAVDQEQHNELWWLLPTDTTPSQPGQYEIVLATGKRTTRNEILKVAKSMK